MRSHWKYTVHGMMANRRLVALLLILLLSLPSLTGHAAMHSCVSDCSVAQMSMGDDGAMSGDTTSKCANCATLPAVPPGLAVSPEPLASAPVLAMVEYTPAPPRRPPRS